ncbi:MAG TPA: TIGR03013 family XrtA/PEP-CTERM system glycosyltransferase [Candidatus Binatia bacterium]|nr:TIGR03013 family XrtA/PEP-CTERM system glycosyltransferase [Candidatus Binatia bacterium]
MWLFNRYYTVYDLLLVLGDVALVLGASLVVRAGFGWSGSTGVGVPTVSILRAAMVALIVVIAFYYSDLYAIDQTLSLHELSHRFAGGLGVACIITGLVSYPVPNFGKSIYVSEMVTMGLSLALWRLGFMKVIKQAGIRAKILIMGNHTIGRLVAEEIYLRKKLGMEVIGFVGDKAGRVSLSYGNPRRVEIPVFTPDSLAGLVAAAGVNRILVAGFDQFPASYYKELVAMRAMGVPVEDCHSFYERLASKIAITDLPPEWIALSKGFRRGRLILAAKRTIDVLASFLGLILSAPIALLTAIAIRLESPGPILYRQERVGQNEKRFILYKFRSMTREAEASSGPVWAAEDDPRVTRVGAIIRKLRIDEIPQMVNVLKGEMSFVGPRPERPFFVEQLKQKIPYYDLRHSVKPGITGWAQICYRYGDSEQDAAEKLQYDLFYVKHMSPVFDLQIIFESLKVILLGWGAR